MSLTKASFSMINGAVANVLDYGAVGDGTTDDTAAFNAAIATGKKVYVPKTTNGYVVNNVGVVTNMVIEGEKSGISAGPTLIVSTNNAGAFTVTTQAFQIEISNFIITAATGVTGARAYKQLDKSYYTAYARFTGIETSSKLAVSYDLFPIFTVWRDCRDGYVDAALAQGHQAINVTPATWTQGNQSNINKIVDCSFWGANGSNCAGTNAYVAMLDIAYGDNWSVENTDFEACNIQAVRARGIYTIAFRSARFEGIADYKVVSSDITPSNPIGTAMYFTNCVAFMGSTLTTGYFAYIGAASFIEVNGCTFLQTPSNVFLSTSTSSVRNAFNLNVVGAGAAAFLTNVNTVTFSSGKMLVNTGTDSGSGSTIQNNGSLQSNGNFIGQNAISVSTTPIIIAVAIGSGGLCFVNGYNSSGGLEGWWLLAWTKNATVTTIASSNLTTLTVAFTLSTNQLKMNTTSGTLIVNATALL
jgi:hypothetical protein